MLETLHAAGRAVPMPIGAHRYWAMPDDRRRLDEDPDDLILRYAHTHGPFAAQAIAGRFGLHLGQTRAELRDLAAEGRLLSGTFLAAAASDGDSGERQYLHPDVFRIIRSRSLARARDSIRPVDGASYQRMVLSLQGAGAVGGERYDGGDGVLRVIEQLEGVALPAALWETAVFPARIRNYRPGMLDELLASSTVAWVGSRPRRDTHGVGDIAWYVADSVIMPDPSASPDMDPILARMRGGGAFPARQLDDGEGGSRFANHMRTLIWQGLITGSTFAPIRSMIGASTGRTPHATGGRTATGARARMRRIANASAYAGFGGLWSGVAAAARMDDEESAPARRLIAVVDMLLDRYGVIAPPLTEAAGVDGGFSALYPVLKAMEENGDLVRGMFVDGLGAAQFARRRDVDALRGCAEKPQETVTALDTLDPANLYGTVLPWPACGQGPTQTAASRPTRRAGTTTVIVDGAAILYAAPRSHHLTVLAPIDDAHERVLRRALGELAYALRRRYQSTVLFSDVNGIPLTSRTTMRVWMRAAGFTPSPQGMKLYP
nr:hypothetical protein [Bifidobacterium catulorum]